MRSSRLTLALAAAVTLGSACSDATDPSDGTPRGLRVMLNGQTLVRVDGGNVTGTLHTHVAEYSGQFIIVPVTSGGDALPSTDGYSLDVVIADPDIASFEAVAPGAFEGEIVSHAEGATTITVRIMESSDADADFVAPPIQLVAVSCAPGGTASAAACMSIRE
jgi:hypothetical protein